MLFEMVTWRLPFEYEHSNNILLAHVKDTPTQTRNLNPNCPPALEEVILKTLSKSPDDRYADMQGFINALKNIAATPAQAAPNPLHEAASVQSQPEIQQDKGGLFGSVKKLFGRGKPAEQLKPNQDTGSKTAPRPHVNVNLPDVDFDDDLEGTVQIDLGPAAAQKTPRLILQEKNVIIDLPNSNMLVMGRTYRNNVVDVDLEPYGASKYGVSRRHAQLLKQGDLWLLEDLNSLNGTFVNTTQVKHGNPVILKDGDTVRLSHMVFLFAQAA